MSTCTECRGRGLVYCFVCHGYNQDPRNPSRPCSYCNGKRMIPCPKCGGTGKD